MSGTPQKLKGGQASELTKLKALSVEDRARVWELREKTIGSRTLTNEEIRGEIREMFGISLVRDGQLSDFWKWQRRQQQYDMLNELTSEDEARLQEKFPGVDREKLRDTVIKRMYAMAELDDDPAFGLRVIAADIKDSKERRDWDKWKKAHQTKVDAGLDELADLIKLHPDLLQKFTEWRTQFNERVNNV